MTDRNDYDDHGELRSWQPRRAAPEPAAPTVVEPVGEVIREPDYWSRGHFHEGRRNAFKGSAVFYTLPVGTKLFADPPAPRAALARDDIRAIFLANGFTIKPGCDDLKEYVYNAARAIEAAHGIGGPRNG